MPGSRDDSLLFSLKALEDLEAQRIAMERAERDRVLEAEARRRADDARRAREVEMRHVEEAEARRLEAERARRDEEAQREAEKLAAIERARAEVDARARSDLARAEAARDVELAKTRAVAARGRYRFFLGLSAAATVAVGAMATVLSSKLRAMTETDERRASALESARRDCERAERALDGARREIGDLRARLHASSAPARDVPDAPKRPAPPKKGFRTVLTRPDDTSSAPCADGDPLGGCLPQKRK